MKNGVLRGPRVAEGGNTQKEDGGDETCERIDELVEQVIEAYTGGEVAHGLTADDLDNMRAWVQSLKS